MTMAGEVIRKRINNLQRDKKSVDENNDDNVQKKDVKLKYGPHVTFPYQRVWSRCILILGVLLVVWYNNRNGKEVVLARQKDILTSRSINVDCSDEYKSELINFPSCVPEKCSRVVSDKLVSTSEVDMLLRFAKNGFKMGELDGGVKILNLHSGILSQGDKFINFYALNEKKNILNSIDLAIYKVIKSKIQLVIAQHFNIDVKQIYLTEPTLFLEITNMYDKVDYNEYWQPYFNNEVFKSFHYTSLLYLNDYGRDFQGGKCIFFDKNGVNTTIEPRKGRISVFTAGSENLHTVEKVTSGTRYSLIIPFTCDKQYAISDPSFERMKNE